MNGDNPAGVIPGIGCDIGPYMAPVIIPGIIGFGPLG